MGGKKFNKEKELNIVENIVAELEPNKSYIEGVVKANEVILLQYDTIINLLKKTLICHPR
jgi:hypothetical protein